ncbi:hypothetical protein DFH28DRAFT_911379 [Melampsora americana]|nr:hypothetical protein DFH28DRAFT_911379 [Melampsora americana]
MARKNRAPPLKPIQRQLRPTTRLQRQHVDQQAMDLAHAQRSTPAIRAYLMQGSQSQQINPQPSEDQGDDHPHLDMQVDDQEVMQHRHYQGQEPDPIVEAMAEARYQESRLQAKNRWATQVAQMVPFFLRCQYWTSNWGNPKLRHHDYRAACGCFQSRTVLREVDLVDCDSK